MATSNSRRAIITDKDPRNAAIASPLDAAIPPKSMTIVRSSPKTSEQAAEEAGEDNTVMANVPKAFTLTTDDGVPTRYEVGAHRMPRAHAEHWFSKVHHVKIV